MPAPPVPSTTDWRTDADQLKFDRVRIASASGAPQNDDQGPPVRGDAARARRCVARPRAARPQFFQISSAYADANAPSAWTIARRPHHHQQPRLQLHQQPSVEHSIAISDPQVIESLNLMRRRRSGSAGLLAYRGEARSADLDAAAVDAYISQMIAEDLTAKDFRTWRAHMLAAVALAQSPEKATPGPGGNLASRPPSRRSPPTSATPDDRSADRHRPAGPRPVQRHHHRPDPRQAVPGRRRAQQPSRRQLPASSTTPTEGAGSRRSRPLSRPWSPVSSGRHPPRRADGSCPCSWFR